MSRRNLAVRRRTRLLIEYRITYPYVAVVNSGLLDRVDDSDSIWFSKCYWNEYDAITSRYFKPACPKPMRKQKPNRWVRTSTIFSHKEKVSQWEWHSE